MDDSASSIFITRRLYPNNFLKLNVYSFSTLSELETKIKDLDKSLECQMISDFHLGNEMGTDVFLLLKNNKIKINCVLLSSYFSDQERQDLKTFKSQNKIEFKICEKPIKLEYLN